MIEISRYSINRLVRLFQVFHSRRKFDQLPFQTGQKLQGLPELSVIKNTYIFISSQRREYFMQCLRTVSKFENRGSQRGNDLFDNLRKLTRPRREYVLGHGRSNQ